MWKIAAAGIAFTLLAVCLKQIKEEYRTYLMLAAGLFFGYYLLEQIRYLIQSMNQLLPVFFQLTTFIWKAFLK